MIGRNNDGFNACLNHADVCQVFRQYEERGGKPEQLREVLHYLWPHQRRTERVPQRRRKTCLQRCASALKDALALEDLHPRLRRSLSQARRDLELYLRPDLTQEEREKVWKEMGLSRPGRRRGPTLESLIPAILAEEFRDRFGRPCYRDILTLVRAVAPARFPEGTEVDHIRNRIKSVPHKIARDYHENLFG
jgi:hypothetical protein